MFPESYNRNNQRGTSLIEVVVVSFFLVSMFTALVSLVMVSVARNRLAKERTVATRLSQQGMEWLRSERDALGYTVFEDRILSGTHNYCINSTHGAVRTFAVSECVDCSTSCTEVLAGYRRWAEITKVVSPPRVEVTMNVGWKDQVITQTGVLAPWQR